MRMWMFAAGVPFEWVAWSDVNAVRPATVRTVARRAAACAAGAGWVQARRYCLGGRGGGLTGANRKVRKTGSSRASCHRSLHGQPASESKAALAHKGAMRSDVNGPYHRTDVLSLAYHFASVPSTIAKNLARHGYRTMPGRALSVTKS